MATFPRSMAKKRCQGAESNRRHQLFQSCALPTELPWRTPVLDWREEVYHPLAARVNALTATVPAQTSVRKSDKAARAVTSSHERNRMGLAAATRNDDRRSRTAGPPSRRPAVPPSRF